MLWDCVLGLSAQEIRFECAMVCQRYKIAFHYSYERKSLSKIMIDFFGKSSRTERVHNPSKCIVWACWVIIRCPADHFVFPMWCNCIITTRIVLYGIRCWMCAVYIVIEHWEMRLENRCNCGFNLERIGHLRLSECVVPVWIWLRRCYVQCRVM